jgi:hypothetical protein
MPTDCPSCGNPMNYPTSCRCTFAKRVAALAGIDEGDEMGRATTIKVNRAMRALDESDLWPVRGRFNVTDRAIRRTRAYLRESGDSPDVFLYAELVDGELSRIVNDPATL